MNNPFDTFSSNLFLFNCPINLAKCFYSPPRYIKLEQRRMRMIIKIDDLTDKRTIELINTHLAGMAENSPAESIHALNVKGLKQDNITFYSAWEDNEIMGCGALKELTPIHGEVKSMRTAEKYLRKGVASAMLHHIINEAKMRGYKKLSIETGSMEAFKPAHRLYESFGFTYCEPFDNYLDDPNSLFMTINL